MTKKGKSQARSFNLNDLHQHLSNFARF